MSRLDKHRARREQIKIDGAIQTALGSVSARVQSFRAELDAIDPRIARPARPVSIALLDLLTVDPKRGSDASLIEDFVGSEDFAALSAMRTRAELLIYGYAEGDVNGRGYEAGWLSVDRGMELLRDCISDFRRVEAANATFEQNSPDYFQRFGKILSLARKHAQSVDEFGVDGEGRVAGVEEETGSPQVSVRTRRSTYLPYLIATFGFLALLVIFVVLLIALMAV